ncbi:NADH-quinone oxidoreductase subunit A [bacterium]|nr:NADH-quinone oxidoreductase subunit A [bacterium]
MSAYIPLTILILAAGVIGIMFANLSRLLGPFRPNEKKLTPYESGMDPVGSAHERFSVKFYLVAMLFILFDIEVVFMYPWAVQYKELLNGSILGTTGPTLFPLIEMLVFIGILFVGYIYVYKKGGLSWT